MLFQFTGNFAVIIELIKNAAWVLHYVNACKALRRISEITITLANMKINEKMPRWALYNWMNNSDSLFYGAQKRTRTSTPCGTRT
ncbi:protein of unknown function [Candidatus Nitrotoga arctica]|uniref:Tn3 transposase DDE domain-containing protein n=1 Tax=Candidatus Nitrotoga arctica TaxID=453162 RepID=A0ABM8Z0J4_9PROT|nr:protein of unknown function [Candidatus Nitrotoga arctica]